jgi:quercetin dioxygenase-like cupin family protein
MSTLEVHNLSDLARFDCAAPAKTVFYEHGTLKAQVMGLEPGQCIPPCSMSHDVVFVVLEGEGEIVADAERCSVRSFSWVLVPKETRSRSIEAATKMTVLAMQAR